MPFKSKEDKLAYQRKYYSKRKRNKDVDLKIKIKNSKRNKDFIVDYISNHPCVDCG